MCCEWAFLGKNSSKVKDYAMEKNLNATYERLSIYIKMCCIISSLHIFQIFKFDMVSRWYILDGHSDVLNGLPFLVSHSGL